MEWVSCDAIEKSSSSFRKPTLRMKIFYDIRPLRSEDVCAGEGTITTTDDEGVDALFDEV
jgi:hypothetical protein